MSPNKVKIIEKKLGHKIPHDLLRDSSEEVSSAMMISCDTAIGDEYVTDSTTPSELLTQSSYMIALASTETSPPYKIGGFSTLDQEGTFVIRKIYFNSLSP